MRIEDALAAVEGLIEKSNEYDLPLWIMSLDLRKAFDTVEHTALVQAMSEAGLPASYIALIYSTV